jgi:hypothetical protein
MSVTSTDMINYSDRKQDLKMFMQEARAISNTYECALRSAESLIERDTLSLQERLHITESELKQAQAQARISAAAVLKKDEKIYALHHTLNHVAHTLGTYIQHSINGSGKPTRAADTENVLQMIKDFGELPIDSQARYVRIPETTYLDLLTQIHIATGEVEKYRGITKDQDALIKSQSDQLDRQLDKYEDSLKTIKSRDHEVMLLCQRNTELEEKVETYEIALQRNQAAIAERDQSRHENKLLQEELNKVHNQARLQLEEKDATITDLLQKLGSAREEVLARQADVRNVITQTQAMLVPPGDVTNETPVRGFKPSKNKEKKRSFLPHAQSSIFLGFQHINADLMTTPTSNPDSKYSNKEVASCDKKSFHTSCGSSKASTRSASTTPSQRRGSDDPFGGEPNMSFRPRNESLGAVGRDGVQNAGYHAITRKELPAAPPTIAPRVPSTLLSPNPFDTSSPPPMATTSPLEPDLLSSSPFIPPHARPQNTESPILPPSTYDPNSLSARSPARRVLSLIPEASESERGSPQPPSASSSDKEMYRRSIFAFDMLNLNDSAFDADDEDAKRGGKVLDLRGGAEYDAVKREQVLNSDVLNGKINSNGIKVSTHSNANDNGKVRSTASTPAKDMGKYQYPDSLRPGYKPQAVGAPVGGHARSRSDNYARNFSNEEQTHPVRPSTANNETRSITPNANFHAQAENNEARKISGNSVGHSKSSSQGSLSSKSSEIMTVSQMYNGLMSGR